MAQPSVCTTCYGTNLVLQGGFLTCADCGTQAQVRASIERSDAADATLDAATARRRAHPTTLPPPKKPKQTLLEETEYGDAAQGRARRSIRAPRAAGTGAPDDSAARQLQQTRRAAEGAALLYARALQALARAQARALQARFGAHGDVEALVRQLWLPTVAASGLLEPGIVERAVPSPAPAAAAAVAGREDEGGGGSNGAAAAAAAATTTTTTIAHTVLETRPEALQRRFGAALPAQTTLAVAFAALALSREPVVPADVIAWALDGALPFAELPTIAQPLLARAVEEGEEGEAARTARTGGDGGGEALGPAAAKLAAGALHAQITLSPAQLAERAEQVAALALRAAAGGDEEEDGDERRPIHALPPANGEALLRRLGRELAAAATSSGGGGSPCDAAAVPLALELHDMYLLGTPALAFVRDPVPFGAAASSAAVASGPWAAGAGPVPLAGGGGGAGDGGGGDNSDEDGAPAAGAGGGLPTWVGQGMGRHAHPYAALAAALVVALKLLHGSLEGQEAEEQEAAAADDDGAGRRRPRPSILPGPAEGWQRWATRAVRRGPQPRGGLDDDDEEDGASASLSRQGAKARRRAFLLAARRGAFAGSGPPEALEDVQRVLMTLAQVADDDEEGGAPQQQQQQREEQEEQAQRAERAGNGSNKRKRPRQDEERSDASAADGRYALAADAATARAPPDYVAVLAAVAAHAHTDPFTLHALVRQLERRMLAAESSLRALAGGVAAAAAV
jgi:hypothetical protein